MKFQYRVKNSYIPILINKVGISLTSLLCQQKVGIFMLQYRAQNRVSLYCLRKIGITDIPTLSIKSRGFPISI